MAIGTATLIAGGASLLGGVVNFLANQSASDRAAMLQDKNLQEWLKLNIPDPKDQQLALEKFVVQGKLDPKLESAIKADPSEFKNIATSVETKSAQNRALAALEKQGYEGGLGLKDKATIQDALLNQQVKDRADRESISAEMARRGIAGSGFDVASRLQGQQVTSDQAARNSLNVAAAAQERALQAIQGAGTMAGQLRSQDFGEQAQRAAAADKINMFNTQNLQDIQQRNIGSQNRAAEMNLNQAQDIANKNIQLANTQQEHNKNLLQQQYENEARKLAGVSGQYNAAAGSALQSGQNVGNFASNIGSGIAGVATTQANKDYWDNYFKNNKKG